MNGHLICLIGLTTKATLEDGNKSVVNSLSFIDYCAAVNYSMYLCQKTVSKQLFDNIESVVLLTHIESDQKEGGDPTGPAAELARDVTQPKVDAVISGHSHKMVNGTIQNLSSFNDVCVGQASTEGRGYVDLTFKFDNSKILLNNSINKLGLSHIYEKYSNEYVKLIDNKPFDIIQSFILIVRKLCFIKI